MISSNGRLFIKINENLSNKIPPFNFYNYASVESFNYNAFDNTIIKSRDNGNYKLNGILFKENKTVSFDLKTYMFSDLSLLKYIIDNQLTVDMQIHYGKCSQPNSFLEYEKVININSAFLSNYSLSNLLALTSENVNKVEESVSISAHDFKVFNKPKLYNIGLVNQSPIIKLVKYKNIYIGLQFEYASGNTNLNLIYSENGIGWNIRNINTLVSNNPYHFDLKIKNDNIYILSRNVDQLNNLYIIKINSISNKIINSIFQIDTLFQKINLGISLITAMEIAENFIIFGTADGKIIKFNINTLESNLIEPKIINNYITNIHSYNEQLYCSCINGYVFKFNIYNNNIEYYKFGNLNFENIFINDNILYLSTNNKLYYSVDFYTINEINNNFNNIKCLAFYDKNIGYLCDNNFIYKTIDAGFSWEKLALNYNIVGLFLYNDEVLLYGTSEELGTFKSNSILHNENEFGNGSLMI